MNGRILYSNIILQSGNNIFVSSAIKINIIISILSGLVSFTLVFTQVKQYRKLKKFVSDSKLLFDKNITDYILKQKEKLKVNKNVKVVISDLVKTPSVFGIIEPVICLPENTISNYKTNDLSFIISHELIHIKHHDILIRTISLLAIGLNWFNPFCYLVFMKICEISEIYCDWEIIKSRNENDVIDYGNLLINMAVEQTYNANQRYSTGLINNSKKILRRRILEMKKRNQKKLKFLPMFVTFFVLTAGTSTVFAYTQEQLISFDEECFNIAQIDGYHNSEWGEFSNNSITENGEVTSGNYFLFSDGTLEKAEQTIQNNTRHSHTFISGTYVSHLPKGSGCVMEYYNGKRCSLCGYIKVGSLTNKVTYKKCIH